MERVGATGLQLGVGRGSERGPRSWQQGYTASNPDRQWRPAQGDSVLPRPAVDNQWLSRAASDTEGFIIGIWGLPGSNHRRFGCPAPRAADSSLAGAHTRCSGLPPTLQGGPVTGFGAGRCTPPGSGPRPQSADDLPGLGPRRGARVRWGPPLGQRPRVSGTACDSRSPTLLFRLGEPPGSARSGPAYRQGRSLLTAPSSSSRPCARSGGETATPLSPPVHSGRVTLF
ncbi:hypothetical protein NDU88_000627 [Pleurodeles waltl]|uniref:Uncharacterized protein n=1 Tax=Pleurodeles waltl TaxID=8319 RepID=A0AAV7WG22_PLEWA|nr:hypothetical protein NDU88_000627 [Pleurodeles waltl]